MYTGDLLGFSQPVQTTNNLLGGGDLLGSTNLQPKQPTGGYSLDLGLGSFS